MLIMMSASSSTNMLIFFKSMTRRLKHQSSIVPGVPMMICSSSALPCGTARGEMPSQRLQTRRVSAAQAHSSLGYLRLWPFRGGHGTEIYSREQG